MYRFFNNLRLASNIILRTYLIEIYKKTSNATDQRFNIYFHCYHQIRYCRITKFKT